MKATLSGRLQAVADLVTRGLVAADVGCDHGYVAIYLIQQGICPRVIAMDVKEGPLTCAGEHIGEAGLWDYIETRLSDGISALRYKAGEEEPEAEALILAGMGGRLTVRILREGRRQLRSMKELVLQPQSEIHLVRKYLREIGYLIAEENMILEDGKYYTVIKAVNLRFHGSGPATPAKAGMQLLFDRYGELLIRNRNPVLKSFLLKQRDKYHLIMEQIHAQETLSRKTTESTIRIKQEMEEIEQVLAMIGKELQAEGSGDAVR